MALLAVAAVVVVTLLNSAAPQRAVPAASSTTTGTESPATGLLSTGEPTASAGSAPSIPGGTVPPAPIGSLAQTGPGLTEPGIALIASPAADGSFDVVERIRLASPVDVLTLRPAPIDQAGRQFASASADASQVRVGAADEQVDVPLAAVDTRLDLPVPGVDRFELHYRLADVTVRSTPSTAGRALAAIGPLAGGVAEDLPVLFIVSGDSVLGLSCPLLPLSQQSCGSRARADGGLEHELPWRLALATVQLNLPLA